MPVWVLDLNLLYVLVPRTGSTGMRIYLMERYRGLDLRQEPAREQGLVIEGHGLEKHSDFSQVWAGFRPPVRWSKIVRIAGVRNPADSLFSSWWKHRYHYPSLMADLDQLAEGDRVFLENERTRRRMEETKGLTFSEWVLKTVQLPSPRPPPWKRAVKDVREAAIGIGNRSGRSKYKRVGSEGLWYQGANVYLRFESLNDDWRDLCRSRGWPHMGDLPVFNETEGRPRDYASYLNERAAARLRTAYSRELARFSYEIRAGSD
ncbi:MAG: hypothetical protein Q8P61_09180 [Candidatus Nanopelagicales bacterium]|nr:hypothetical protein [Candidatus Nanopelagicales bacterium]